MQPRRPRLPPLRRAAALLLAPILAGCTAPPGDATAPPGFSADTFTRDGLVSGATATEAGCRALPDAVWIEARGRRECLRYAVGGTGHGATTAIVYIPGDPAGIAYRYAGGRMQVDRVNPIYEATAESRRVAAETLAGAMEGVPVFLMARPGMYGSSGNHGEDRHTLAEVDLLDAALTALKQRHGLRDFVLSGFSSGGLIVANLLARRHDIRCAVIASAPLDLTLFHRGPNGMLTEDFALREAALADPMRSVDEIRPGAEIFVIGDSRDRSVPHAAWGAWVRAARAEGLSVTEAAIRGGDRPELGGGPTYHITARWSLEVAYGCATGWTAERLRAALQAGTPILQPRGQRLSGAEIRAAFAGQRLEGVTWSHWGTRAALSTVWGEGGQRDQYQPAHPGQRLASQRWWVEGDRLCVEGEGCHAVLRDGRFLTLVEGEPTRLLATYVEGPADGQAVAGRAGPGAALADRVGFEPTVGVNPRRFSRPLP